MCKDDLKLEQLLKDPLVRLVMASDGVKDADLLGLARPRAGAGLVFGRRRAHAAASGADARCAN
jgi:hypothetical protein